VTQGLAEGTVVFLTGATGFIGRRLAEELHARGCRLRCLVRNPQRAAPLQALGAELILGDVVDPTALRHGMQGADVALHLAAMYDVGRVDVAAMERTNIEGTRAFLDALRESGVRRGVYVSSIVALGPVTAGEGDETSRYDGPFPSHYHRTKTIAHRIAEQAQAGGLPLVIACPGYVYGPGDEGPAGDFVNDLLQHRLPGLPTKPTVFSYVYVDDVVDGLIAICERGAAGETYVLSGEAASTNEFAGMVVNAAGTWLSPLRFPPAVVMMTGSLMDVISSLTGWRLPLNRENARVGGTGERWVHSHRKATVELGYQPRPLSEGVLPTVRDAQQRLHAGK
jgi:dihydroflavonol-4-reductase